MRIAEDAGYDFDLLKGVITVNEEQFDRVVDKIERRGRRLARRRDGRRCGASRSRPAPTTSASRPSLEIIRRLRDRGARIQAYDPAVEAGDTEPGSTASRSWPTRTRPATAPRCCAVLTEWDEFKWLDFDKVAETMAQPAGGRRPEPPRPRRRSRGAASSYEGIGRA